MHDAADDALVVNPRFAARIGWKMRLDPRKLRIRQPEQVPIHCRFLSEAVNYSSLIMPMILWVRTLVRNTAQSLFESHKLDRLQLANVRRVLE
jgi:hypothetical protein